MRVFSEILSAFCKKCVEGGLRSTLFTAEKKSVAFIFISIFFLSTGAWHCVFALCFVSPATAASELLPCKQFARRSQYVGMVWHCPL